MEILRRLLSHKPSSTKYEEQSQAIELLLRYPTEFFILNNRIKSLSNQNKFYIKQFSKCGGLYTAHNFLSNSNGSLLEAGEKPSKNDYYIYFDNHIPEFRKLIKIENSEPIHSSVLILFFDNFPLCFISFFQYKDTVFINQIQGFKISDRKANVISKFNYPQSLINILEQKINIENSAKNNVKKIIGIGLNQKIKAPFVFIKMFTTEMEKFIERYENEYKQYIGIIKDIFENEYKNINFNTEYEEDLLHEILDKSKQYIEKNERDEFYTSISNYDIMYYFKYLKVKKEYFIALQRYDESFEKLGYIRDSGFFVKSLNKH